MIERERKFLVASVPSDLDEGAAIRQGYVAVDGAVSVRVRAKGGSFTLTIKGGEGLERTEVEFALEADQFEALWALTGGRRVEKTRHRVPLDDLTAELDLFTGALRGLRIVEVEFDSAAAAAAFAPPGWFGAEVTDDHRYTNAWISTHGRPE